MGPFFVMKFDDEITVIMQQFPEPRHPAEARGPVFANAKTCVADIYVFHRKAMKNSLRGKSSLCSAWAPRVRGVTALWNNFSVIETGGIYKNNLLEQFSY